MAAVIGFVGVMPAMLLLWIRSDIKGIIAKLAEHGERLTRIETVLGARSSSPEQGRARAG